MLFSVINDSPAISLSEKKMSIDTHKSIYVFLGIMYGKVYLHGSACVLNSCKCWCTYEPNVDLEDKVSM